MTNKVYRNITLIAFILVLPAGIEQKSFAQPVYGLRTPFTNSACAGAEFHIMMVHELSILDNYLVPSQIFKNEDILSKSGNILYRLLRMGTYNFYMSYIPVVNQHEYFGHLARAKQLKAGFTRYEIFLFPPEGGRAFFGNHKYHPLTASERISEHIAGMEANSIMSEELLVKSLQNGSMSFQENMLYLGSKSDFLSYVLFENNGSSDDITNYLNIINESPDIRKEIKRKDLVLPALLTGLFDSFTIKSICSQLGLYLLKGHNSFDTPTFFKSGNTGFLPYYSFEPSAGLPNHNIGSFITHNKQVYRLNIHRGAFGNSSDYGIRLCYYGSGQDKKDVNFDFDIRYWHTCVLNYHNPAGIIENSPADCFLVSGRIFQKLPLLKNNTYNIYMITGISYKTGGYTKGYPFTEGLRFNLGIGYRIKNHIKQVETI